MEEDSFNYNDDDIVMSEEDGVVLDKNSGSMENGSEKEEETRRNKLKHNIKSKGQNSYYYAHSKNTVDIPRVVTTQTVPTPTAKPPEMAKTLIQTVEKYSWSDGNKTVSIYIEHPNPSTLAPPEITWTTTGISFKFVDENQQRRALVLDKLYEAIKSAEVKTKADKFVIVMHKENEAKWYKLVGA